mmetsp:Transcript_22873/g.54013  ORF Transcript_22873/g.54013 Transcript_22873/m.54013 type:complete len:122 (-) Transcript_22873:1095-1460(-)
MKKYPENSLSKPSSQLLCQIFSMQKKRKQNRYMYLCMIRHRSYVLTPRGNGSELASESFCTLRRGWFPSVAVNQAASLRPFVGSRVALDEGNETIVIVVDADVDPKYTWSPEIPERLLPFT